MKTERLCLLLLGGCISLTGAGCAAFQAAVDRPAPATASRNDTSSRLVSIARVYENQGRLAQAEETYRRALRYRPQDPTIRQQMQQVAARRKARQFSASPSESALAAADAVSGSSGRASFSDAAGDRSRQAARTRSGRPMTDTAAAASRAELTPRLQRDLDQAVAWADFAPLPPDDRTLAAASSPMSNSTDATPGAPSRNESPNTANAASKARVAEAAAADAGDTPDAWAANASSSDVSGRVAVADSAVERVTPEPVPQSPVRATVEPSLDVFAEFSNDTPKDSSASIPLPAAADTVAAADASAATVAGDNGEDELPLITPAAAPVAEMRRRVAAAASDVDSRAGSTAGQVAHPAVASAAGEELPAVAEDDSALPLPPAPPVTEDPISVAGRATFHSDPVELPPVRNSRDHVDLLIDSLNQHPSVEQRAVSAVLLGDCDRDDVRIREALAAAIESQSDPAVLLAVCDSQIQRGEHDRRTARCLGRIASNAVHSEHRVQAAHALRNFVDSESQVECEIRLVELLSHDQSAVRTAAALTLSEFGASGGDALSELTVAAANDGDQQVREAALLAVECLTRRRSSSENAVPLRPAGEQAMEIVPGR